MSSSLFDLRGKVALVTGATRGLGRAIAERMAEAGAQIIVSSEDAANCESAAAEMSARGYDVAGVPCDVSSKAQIETLVARALDLHGRLTRSSATPASRLTWVRWRRRAIVTGISP